MDTSFKHAQASFILLVRNKGPLLPPNQSFDVIYEWSLYMDDPRIQTKTKGQKNKGQIPPASKRKQ